MGLTGEGFFALVIVGVIVLPVLTILLWNRIPGPKPVKLGSRLGMIVMSQAVAVLLAALWINNTFQLYDSWSDVVGDNGATGVIQAATPQGLGKTAVDAKGGVRGDTLPNAKLFTEMANVQDGYQTTITGPGSKIQGAVMVWLPPQYFQAAYAHSEFPVVELLSGTPGTPQTWLEAMQAPWVVSRQTPNQEHPFILVSPAINVDGYHDPDCSNIPHGPQVATWLTADVRNLMRSSFRVSNARDAWGLMGYSEGGLCASKLALQYPSDYAAAVSISGDDHPDGDLLKPGTAAYDENSPLWLLQHRPAQNVALLLTGTRQDSDVAQEAAAMVAAAKYPTTVDTLISARGGHNIGVWKSVEPQSFVWLSDHLEGPKTTTYSALPEMIDGVTG